MSRKTLVAGMLLVLGAAAALGLWIRPATQPAAQARPALELVVQRGHATGRAETCRRSRLSAERQGLPLRRAGHRDV